MVELVSAATVRSVIEYMHRTKMILPLLGILTAMLAWPSIFSTLAIYDDEGYIMMTLQTYMQGHRLYGETHTQYGPAFYLIVSPLHSILDWPLTQTGVRIKTILCWMIAVLLCYAIVRRISQSAVAGVATGLLAAMHLDKLSLEPGHPQEVTLLITLLVLFLVSRSIYLTIDAVPNFLALSSWLTFGFLAGIVALVKMNCGVVVAIPLIIAAAVQMKCSRSIRWGLVTIVLAPALLLAWLARSDFSAMVWAVWIGSCAAFLAFSAIPKDSPYRNPSQFPLVATIFGGLVSTTMIVGISLAQGISVAELWLGLVGQHSHFAAYFFRPIGYSYSALIGVAIAVIAFMTQHSVRGERIAKLFFWISVVTSIAYTCVLPLQHGAIPRGAGMLLAWAAPGWIVWMWRRDVANSPQKLILGLIAILSPLIAFPVAGTQVAIGTLPSLLVIGIFLGEYLVEFRKEPEQIASGLANRSLFIGDRFALFLALLVMIGSAGAHWTRYFQGEPLGLSGTLGMRLSAALVEEQRSITQAIQQSGASHLMFEGSTHNRFYFWTGIAPLTTANPPYWPIMLFDEERKELREAILQKGRLCVVRVPEYDVLYCKKATEIREELAERWKPAASHGEWQIGTVE